MSDYQIAPSILSADFARLGEEVDNVLAAGADIVHFDVMDNHYVPNLTIGPLICEALRKHGVEAPIDVHLMVKPVDRIIPDFASAGASYITFHPEASEHIDRSLGLIRDSGCRAGLVFKLKQTVGEEAIEAREQSFVTRAIASWSDNPNIGILGNKEARRLSIVSFLIRRKGRYLHHNFVVALLNDLFGIQARGGCSCAGPYGHRLLGIDMADSTRFRDAIDSGCEGIKPGWVRVNFNYFISEEVFNYILNAVHLVAEEGWKLLPYYEFSIDSGLWRHRDQTHGSELGFDDLSFESGQLKYHGRRLTQPEGVLKDHLEDARRIIDEAEAEFGIQEEHSLLAEELERLRWFPLPGGYWGEALTGDASSPKVQDGVTQGDDSA